MRFVLLVVLLQACVSSSIQLDRDSGDGGPVDTGTTDTQGPDATLDAPLMDASRDARSGDAGSDASPCSITAPQPFLCYDVTCAVVEAHIDNSTCEVVCDPPPEGCLTGCGTSDDECFVGYECCGGPDCSLVARNRAGHEDHLAFCPEDTPPPALEASCIANVCELDFSVCVPEEEQQCVEILDPSGDCGGNFALNLETVDVYIELICPSGDDMLPPCCEEIESTEAACGADNFCQPL